MNRPHASDHRFAPRRPYAVSGNHSLRRSHPFLRIRRSRKATFLVVVGFFTFLYYTIAFFFSYSLNDGEFSDSYNPFSRSHGSRPPLWSYSPHSAQSDLGTGKKGTEYTYDYAIRFPNLYRTISRASTSGRADRNRIVLFAAGNVESASKLAILACQMARERRNLVHLAFMMRDEMDMEKWAIMNNIGSGRGDCEVDLHDARLDHSGISTLKRSKQGIKGALVHFKSFMHPQAVLVDTEGEEDWWLESLKEGCVDAEISSILLPKAFLAGGLVDWVKKLDSGALRVWNDIKIEIVIRVGEHNGNLIRLLRSLEAADMFGLKKEAFHLTLEIPRRTQPSPFTFDFLRGYSWPSPDRVRLKRPLTLASDSPDTLTAAIRFAEEWYPSNDKSYLLLLDDNVEVSEFFWHWVWYNVLQYRHSFYMNSVETDVYGISLLPLALDFFPSGQAPIKEDAQSQLLITTPSANATILFPKHFFHYRYYLSQLDQSITTSFEKSEHFVEREERGAGIDPMRVPHYLRPLHSLAKARGWSMLYPSLPTTPKLSEIPVFLRSHWELPSTPRPDFNPNDEKEARQVLATSALAGLSNIPNHGDLLRHELLRWVNEDTGKVEPEQLDSNHSYRNAAASKFRQKITGCYDHDQNEGGWMYNIGTVSDLFCPVKSKEEIEAEEEKKKKEREEKQRQIQLENLGPEEMQDPNVEANDHVPKRYPVKAPEVETQREVEATSTDESQGDQASAEPQDKKPWRNKLGHVQDGKLSDEEQEIPDEVQVAGRLFKVPKPPVKPKLNQHQDGGDAPDIPEEESLEPHQQEKLKEKLDLGGLLIATGKPPLVRPT